MRAGRRVLQSVAGGPPLAADADRLKPPAVVGVGAGQGLGAARPVGGFAQPTQGVVAEPRGLALGVGELGQQPVGGVVHPPGFARRVDHPRQIAVAVDAQFRGLGGANVGHVRRPTYRALMSILFVQVKILFNCKNSTIC